MVDAGVPAPCNPRSGDVNDDLSFAMPNPRSGDVDDDLSFAMPNYCSAGRDDDSKKLSSLNKATTCLAQVGRRGVILSGRFDTGAMVKIVL